MGKKKKPQHGKSKVQYEPSERVMIYHYYGEDPLVECKAMCGRYLRTGHMITQVQWMWLGQKRCWQITVNIESRPLGLLRGGPLDYALL